LSFVIHCLKGEAIGPNKPFRDLAWGLASQGIAVLRGLREGNGLWGLKEAGIFSII
jgi:hypothetical protein